MQSIPSVVIFTSVCVVAVVLLSWSVWSNRKRTKKGPVLQDLRDQYNLMCDRQELMIKHLFRINPDPKGTTLPGSSNASSEGKSDVPLRN